MEVSPHEVLRQVAEALPPEVTDNVIVVGSLAAAIHFFSDGSEGQVRTKDIDCLLSPRIVAVAAARSATQGLIEAGWVLRREGQWGEPGNADTPENLLPVPRLRPSDETPWFLEILSAPAPDQSSDIQSLRLDTDRGTSSCTASGT